MIIIPILILVILLLLIFPYYMLDDFFYRMTTTDLKMYNATSKLDFAWKYYNNVGNFTPSEMKIINKLDEKADSLLPIAVKVIYKKNTLLDPHTLRNYIFLPSVPDLETIIHEKIHVIQRYNPDFMKQFGFVKTDLKLEKRNNPDNDDFIYSYNGKPFYFKYNGTSYRDGHTVNGDDFLQDSPNETIAYYLARKLARIPS